jgi:hypothetical protein
VDSRGDVSRDFFAIPLILLAIPHSLLAVHFFSIHTFVAARIISPSPLRELGPDRGARRVTVSGVGSTSVVLFGESIALRSGPGGGQSVRRECPGVR